MTNEEAQEVKGIPSQGHAVFSQLVCLLYMQEEREVLASIYESDDCFKQTSLTSFSYRVHTHEL